MVSTAIPLNLLALGFGNRPDILTVQHPHVRLFQPNTTWTFILPHRNNPMNATLTIVHTETVDSVDFVLRWHHDPRPCHLVIPKTQLLAPVQIPEPVRLLFKHLEMRCLQDMNWPPLLKLQSTAWETRQHCALYTRVRVEAQNISCANSYHPRTWAVTEIDTKLKIGRFVYLIEGEVPGIPFGEAKVVGIRALELDWVEFVVQMHPQRAKHMYAEFAYLAIPLAHAEIDRVLEMKYEGTKQFLNDERASTSCMSHPRPFTKGTTRIKAHL
ncbi:hypothetical protein NM688_g4755 [Phlebia brevispora]|uniref:Uncharacterized protein n=1 Tax=Phlebia brevispora TaxID=194682 RepID=A0ACC1T210_9APHY|nr:hypothetical protein NM688_g4755 [Phlebia brevispora]